MLARNRHAFTLVEILCVVTILAIASAIIIPQLSTRDDLKAAAGARVVMADLIWAQNRAISTQQKQYIVFNGQSYTLKYLDSSGTLQTASNPVTKNTYITTFNVASTPLATVSIGTHTFAGKSSLCFDEMGTPWGYDGSGTFSMNSDGQIGIGCNTQNLTITLSAYTGETSVQ
ncbi:MAG TPA: prepilin-type N-terminal cleavage/methylation domain-containing protein [Tepidisphaeraceae bacterium]|jgi:prepilin-type N-terminal cleavage/methylation domain-containing protein|nr:prepilin-type N-terminal cleavage/methylation domain-containing protein [Tepidisphaeraceae bacterium]